VTRYNELKLDLVVNTLRALRSRIEERFPGSGLGHVAEELIRVAEETGPFIERLRRPNWLLRVAIATAVSGLASVPLILAFRFGDGLSLGIDGAGALLQIIESAIQDIVFLAIAIYFLLTLETRLDRRVSLRELHRLRTIVHIVDMHQLTKDPEHLLTPGNVTASSPERRLTRFELARYLDYCTELLSLSSKLAALHAQYLNDPVVLNAVNDIEVLASNLSNKIWQKIVILDTVAERSPEEAQRIGSGFAPAIVPRQP